MIFKQVRYFGISFNSFILLCILFLITTSNSLLLSSDSLKVETRQLAIEDNLTEKKILNINSFLNISNEYRFYNSYYQRYNNYSELNPFSTNVHFKSNLFIGNDFSSTFNLFIRETFSNEYTYSIGILPPNPTPIQKLYNSNNRLSVTSRYKNIISIDIGTINPYISELTINGMNIFGGKINVNVGKIRMGAFYGISQMGVNEYALFIRDRQQIVMGAYERKILGFNFGLGNQSSNYFDLSILKMHDDTNKSKPNAIIRPQEGINLLLKSKMKLIDNLNLNIELASSLFTNDLRQTNFDLNETKQDTLNSIANQFNNWYYDQNNFVKKSIKSINSFLKFGLKTSTNIDFAGNILLDYKSRNLSLKFLSKYIGSGYEPIGSYYNYNKEYLEFKLIPFVSAYSRKINFYGNLGYRINNINSATGFKTNTMLGNFNINYFHTNNFNIGTSLFYHNILSEKIYRYITNDLLQVERLAEIYLTNFSLNSKYVFESIKNNKHAFDLSASYELYNDKSNDKEVDEKPYKFFIQSIYNYFLSSQSYQLLLNYYQIKNYGLFINLGIGTYYREIPQLPNLDFSSEIIFNLGKQITKGDIYSLILRPNIKYKIYEKTTLSLYGNLKYGKDLAIDYSSPESIWLTNNFFETYLNLNISQEF